jgi:TolB-like protein/DNA-binding winged helix-turn-helix (wHTH) protein/Flp pilus assembly protein TadD
MEATDRTSRTRFDAFDVDMRSGEVRKHGIRLKLHGQPFQVLSLLLEHPGDVVMREELRQKLWPADTFVDFDTGLNSAIKKLRDALGDSAEEPRYIETLPRRGYRFIAPLADIPPVTVPLPPAGSDADLGEKIARLGASGPSRVPMEKRPASARFKVLFGAIAVLALSTFAFALYHVSFAKHASQPTIRSLVVLPLKNLSGDSAQEYLADGMTEALIGRLSGIHDLRVISRTSAMHFKDTQLSVPEIAKTLGVDAVVEGSVIRDGNRIRVHAQLIRAATDEHFWSETYDRELGDVLALQSDVAQAIARKVEVTVTGQERTRLVTARYISPEVYESYLKGQFALGKGDDRSDVEESISDFDEAIKKDREFAGAYVGLADAYDRLGTVFAGGSPAETRPEVIGAARKALELDSDLAEAHVLLADVYQEEWRWSEAEAEYEWALRLRPNDAETHLGLASWLLAEGRTEEAMEWSKRARELDPAAVTGSRLGWILFSARHYDEAIRELHATLAVTPNDAIALWYLGFSLIGEGKPGDAIPPLERAVSLTHGSPGAIGVLARAYGHAGRRSQALRLIDELSRRRQKGYVPTAAFVQAYVGLGDYDEAFAWFERAYEEKSNILQWIKVEPFPDAMRNDPRFADLIHRVGLD